jgi:tetratricopeptide (TPR) repeat protein
MSRSGTPQAAAELLGRIVPMVADVLADLDASEQVLEAILNVIPYPSVVLAPAALTRRIISALPGDIRPAQRAAWLTCLGAWLREAGNSADATHANEQAAVILRELAKDTKGSSYPADLVGVLRNLGALYSDTGRHADAVRLSEEAVEAHTRLAGTLPDRSALAHSLDNLADQYLRAGRYEDAVQAAEEAAAIYRELHGALGNQYRPDLARPAGTCPASSTTSPWRTPHSAAAPMPCPHRSGRRHLHDASWRDARLRPGERSQRPSRSPGRPGGGNPVRKRRVQRRPGWEAPELRQRIRPGQIVGRGPVRLLNGFMRNEVREQQPRKLSQERNLPGWPFRDRILYVGEGPVMFKR